MNPKIAGILALAAAATGGASGRANSAPEQESVALTVYNQNFALVKDVRELELVSGTQEVRIDDVAAHIDPTSVHFAALGRGGVSVLEQNYQYDLADAERLLSRYLNQPVTAVLKEGSTREGTLLSYDGGSLVLGDGTGAVILNRAEVRDVRLGAVPGGLVVRPTLVWTLGSERGGTERVEVSYLTNEVNWHAEYVATVNAKDDGLTLNGWVSLDNRSGATYENAKLKLVAGDVHRVRDRDKIILQDESLAFRAAREPQFEEREFFEYHIYTLDRPATVADRETKQLSLFPGAEAKTKKILTYDGAQDPTKVAVRLEVENSRSNGLGMALPAGKVRVYKEDADGALEFVGEDAIDHTPRDETMRLFLGNAFDVVGERKQMDMQQISTRTREAAFEIEIRNHKEESVQVTVVEHLWGDWKITKSSHEHVKKDARTLEFLLVVPARGSVKVTYTARITW